MAGNGLIGSLRVNLGASTADFDRAMDRSRRTVTDTTKRFDSLSRQAQASGAAMKAAFVGIAAGVGVGAARSFLDLADESKNLTAQLTLATAKLGTLGQAQADVARIANTTRESLSGTASLYGNFLRATAQLGGSQADAARATETFGKALKIGGADANAAASATLQFGQALASGALRGDEFNSIAEASPRILSLLADAMGVSQGSVRALAAEGKLTSDVLFKALTDRKFTAGIDKEFSQLPVTFDQAMTLVHNAAVTTFGAFDQGGQFSTMLADFIGRGADGFAGLAKSAEIEGRNIRGSFAGLADVFQPMLSGAHGAFGGMRAEADELRVSIQNILDLYDRIRNVGVSLDRGVQKLDNLNPLRKKVPLKPYYDTGGTFRRGARLSDARLRRDAAIRRLEGQGFEVPRNADGTVNEAGIRKREAFVPIVDRSDPKGKGAGKGRSTPRARRSTGTGGGAAGKADSVRTLIDNLLPDDARQRELLEQSRALGKAMAAGLIPLDVYERASAALSDRLGEVFAKAREGVTAPKVEIGPDRVDLRDGKNAAPDLSKATAAGVSSLAALREALQTLEYQGGDAFGYIAGSIADGLLPMLQDAKDGVFDLQHVLTASAGVMQGLFQSLFGRKGGGLLGQLLNIGVTVGGALGRGKAGLRTGESSYTPQWTPGYGGGRATGGPIRADRWYTVGERGPETFAPGVSGTIIPNGGRGDRARGVGVAHIVPSPYFDVVVDRRAAGVAAPIAQAATSSGLSDVGRANAWRSRQSVA